MSHLIHRSLTAYSSPKDDAVIRFALDRTEPPVPYRTSVPEHSLAAWSKYPNAKNLERKLAGRWEVNPENVIVTAGADEALDRACRASLLPGNEVLTTSPTFEMIAKYAALTGATLTEVPWLDGEFPTDRFAECTSTQTRLIVLVNPNNPTGACLSVEAIELLASRNPDFPIVLDLAYAEFADNDPTSQLLRFPNAVVVRSFSKAWGLPGLRIGYAIGNAEVIQAMRAAGGPYSVSAQSIDIVTTSYEYFEPAMREYVNRVRAEREELEEWLRISGIRFFPSHANFILLFPEDPIGFDEALHARGIATRIFESFPQARRMTLPGDAETFEVLKQALEEILELQSIDS